MNALAIARFWSKVDVKDDLKECWPWTRGVNHAGYGEVKFGGRSQGAHRVALQMFTGDKLTGVIVRHQCDNPACCNPYHLTTGSHNDNVQDRVVRGRSARGVHSGRARLSEEQVRAIRADERQHADIARDYGIDRSTVSHIKKRIIWKHLL